MKTIPIIPSVLRIFPKFKLKPTQLLWLFGTGASAGLIAISCSTGGHAMMAPPSIPGATFVGNDECSQCHEKLVRDFKTADHAKLMAKGENAKTMGCEGCHGPGSKHVSSGGAIGTILNPNKSPDTCFQCHLDKKAQFSLPHAHPVLSGKMSCSDCHDPHKGSATFGGGTQLMGSNNTCTQCHTAQRGPFVFEHEAVREGCTSCHSPHGSVNKKMLTERNANLCLKCHFQQQTAVGAVTIADRNHSGNMTSRTCWSAGCHEQIHGSNTGRHLRH